MMRGMETAAPRSRFLALGDSYTIGEAVRPEESWPRQLAAMLRERRIDVADPEIVARTGWTTEELFDAIRMREDIFSARAPWDLVTLLIGVNDQYRGVLPETYREWLHGVLDAATSFESGADSLIVLSLPDWSVTPFADSRDRAAISGTIDAFNEINRSEAAAAGAAWLDITGSSRRGADDLALLAGDGLHPSGAMYREWAELVLPLAIEILGRKGGGSAAL